MTTPAPRPLRADANRNRARLLQAATAAFRERGADVALEEVARRAEVSIATLYRHFPSREALLEATLREELEALEAQARTLLTAPDALEALTTWLRILLHQALAYQGLPGPLKSILEGDASQLSSMCTHVVSPGADLLSRAQRDGVARTDADFWDLINLVCAIAWATEQPPAPDRAERMLTLVVDGLRCSAGG